MCGFHEEMCIRDRVAMCPVAKVARNAGEFADMLERTLDEASAGLCLSKRCRSWAKRNSWEKRALRCV